MRTDNKLFILSAGRVAALDKKTGDIVWEVKLKEYVKMGAGAGVGQIVLEDEKLFVTISGIALCLSAKDGALVWKNELKGWGYYFVSMAGKDVAMATSEAAASYAATSAATASTVVATTT